jgi:hypothetical protein
LRLAIKGKLVFKRHADTSDINLALMLALLYRKITAVEDSVFGQKRVPDVTAFVQLSK